MQIKEIDVFANYMPHVSAATAVSETVSANLLKN